VLWGQARRRITDRPPARHERSGVLVSAGDQVQAWALRQGRAVLTPTQVDEIWSNLVEHAGRRDELEQRAQPMPRSLTGWVLIALTCVIAALAGFVGAGQALHAMNGNLLPWTMAGGLALAVLEALGRGRPWRWQLRALQLGIASMYVLAGAAVGLAFLTS
jgi:hypothetical protein